jgi:hypothetical protein
MTSRFPQKKAVMASGDTRSKSVTLIGAGKLSPKAVKGSGLDQDHSPSGSSSSRMKVQRQFRN